MNWTQLLSDFGTLLEHRLFEIAGTPVSVATVATVVIVALVSLLVARFVRRATMHALTRRGKMAEGTAGGMARLVQYIVVLLGLGVALQTVGIDLSALFAAGAVFAVTIGFAMQNIVQNFVAGVILLAEGSIKPGDVLTIEGQMVRVTDLGIRATIVQTRDGEDTIVPNSTLIQNTVKNYTLRDSLVRVPIEVGVVYSSDMAKVFETLQRVARKMTAEWGVTDREPQIVMKAFGSSSVDFGVAVWTSTPWHTVPLRSELLHAVWDALAEQHIVIAFPQVDVHFDPTVTKGLAAMAAAS